MLLIRKMRRWTGSDFNRNFFLLFSGSVVGQLIPFAAGILLTRIYSPESFGTFAVYNAMVLILAAVINLRYELAIALPTEHEDAVGLVILSVSVAVLLSGIMMLLLALFKTGILDIIGGQALGSRVFWVPVAVLFLGLYNALNYFSLRLKQYRVIAVSNMIKAGSRALVQVLCGWLGALRIGLIAGDVISNISGNIKMLRLLFKYRSLMKSVTKQKIWEHAVRYKHFPLVSLWSILLSTFSVNINNFFILKLFGLTQLGYYSWGYRYLNLPLALISSNISQLFFQMCIEKKHQQVPATKEFIAVFKRIAFICIPVFTILYLVVEELFAFAFGEEWRLAGAYAKVLMPLLLLRTWFVPLSMVTIAFERQEIMLAMQIGIFMIYVAVYLIGKYQELKIIPFLWLLTGAVTIAYTIALYWLYKIAKSKPGAAYYNTNNRT